MSEQEAGSAGVERIADVADNRLGPNNSKEPRLSKARLDFVKTVSRKTGLETKWLSNRAHGHYNVELDKSLEREMADEIEAWKKTLGARRFKRSKHRAKGQGTRVYALPKNSARFVEKSWNEWD